MCLYSKLVRNPKYKKNKKNGGQIPWCNDPRILYIPIGCGTCIECRRQKSREWKIRLKEEIKQSKNGKFVTLTFNEESLKELNSLIKESNKYEEVNSIAALAIDRFCERWRKKYKKYPRHWLIAEIGHNGSQRMHLHGLIFEDSKEDIIEKWKYGYVYIGKYVSAKTINYISKYVTKMDPYNKQYKSKIWVSKGFGKSYINKQEAKLNKYNGELTDETYRQETGHKTAMPTYYRNKIYTDKEREKLWINKLDKKIKYVNGIEIDVSTEEGIKTYEKVLKQQQEKNEKMGYGKAEEWKIENYREQQKLMEKASKARTH